MSPRQTAAAIDLKLKNFKEELVPELIKLIKEEINARQPEANKEADISKRANRRAIKKH